MRPRRNTYVTGKYTGAFQLDEDPTTSQFSFKSSHGSDSAAALAQSVLNAVEAKESRGVNKRYKSNMSYAPIPDMSSMASTPAPIKPKNDNIRSTTTPSSVAISEIARSSLCLPDTSIAQNTTLRVFLQGQLGFKILPFGDCYPMESFVPSILDTWGMSAYMTREIYFTNAWMSATKSTRTIRPDVGHMELDQCRRCIMRCARNDPCWVENRGKCVIDVSIFYKS